MVQNYEWLKLTLNSGRKFFMKDYQFNEKVLNQVGQYGIRFFMPIDRMFYFIHSETADKVTLKDADGFGFNPNSIESLDIVKDKQVEVKE